VISSPAQQRWVRRLRDKRPRPNVGLTRFRFYLRKDGACAMSANDLPPSALGQDAVERALSEYIHHIHETTADFMKTSARSRETIARSRRVLERPIPDV
jgi:hypothetical protein